MLPPVKMLLRSGRSYWSRTEKAEAYPVKGTDLRFAFYIFTCNNFYQSQDCKRNNFSCLNRPEQVAGFLQNAGSALTLSGEGSESGRRLSAKGLDILFTPSCKSVLKTEGLLTRDARVKERKKYGRKRARKRFQFSKR